MSRLLAALGAEEGDVMTLCQQPFRLLAALEKQKVPPNPFFPIPGKLSPEEQQLLAALPRGTTFFTEPPAGVAAADWAHAEARMAWLKQYSLLFGATVHPGRRLTVPIDDRVVQSGMFTRGFEEAFIGVNYPVAGSSGKVLPEDTRRLLAALGADEGDVVTLCLISDPLGQKPCRLRATVEKDKLPRNPFRPIPSKLSSEELVAATLFGRQVDTCFPETPAGKAVRAEAEAAYDDLYSWKRVQKSSLEGGWLSQFRMRSCRPACSP